MANRDEADREAVRDRDAETRDREADTRHLATASDAQRNASVDPSADDRTASASDGEHSARDRAASAAEGVASSFDDLTGAYRRTPGMIEARREVARMRRTGQPLTFVFVDVDGLKALNDNQGHAAGDDLLRDLAQQIRDRLRNYDLLVRYAGDEFLCVLSDTNASEAAERFDSVNAALALGPVPGSVSVGVVEVEVCQTVEHALAQADAAMHRGREQRQGNQR